MIQQWLLRKIKKYTANVLFENVDTYSDDIKNKFEKQYNGEIKYPATISVGRNILSAKYHYVGLEQLICRILYNYKKEVNDCNLLDCGSGSGYWIDFYKEFGANIVGLEISEKAYTNLESKYQNTDIMIGNMGIREYLEDFMHPQYEGSGGFDIINAIGVMFHIISDDDWEKTLRLMVSALKPNGILIISGDFPRWANYNVDFNDDLLVSKRLRKKKYYKKILKDAGCKFIKFYKNKSYLYINDTQPENNLLVASKSKYKKDWKVFNEKYDYYVNRMKVYCNLKG